MSSLLYKGLGKLQDGVTRVVFGSEVVTSKINFYDCVDRDMKGNEVSMSKYRDNVLLIVNVASNWGLTKLNYIQLPKLYDEFHSSGFQILAFPCNQFGAQEPGTNEEILEFVKQYDENMASKLIFFDKGHVNGSDTREVYSLLKNALPAEDGSTDIRWNFNKFLIDHEGKPYKRYGPKTPPKAIKDDIQMLLNKKNGIVADTDENKKVEGGESEK